jgi:hypothetical protein
MFSTLALGVIDSDLIQSSSAVNAGDRLLTSPLSPLSCALVICLSDFTLHLSLHNFLCSPQENV